MILVLDTSGVLAAFDIDSPESPNCLRALEIARVILIPPLVLAEIDHVARIRYGQHARDSILNFLCHQLDSDTRFQLAPFSAQMFVQAQTLCAVYSDLRLDLADAVSVVTAAEHQTNAVLTLDRRDFRAIRPLSGHSAFRVLPDDL